MNEDIEYGSFMTMQITDTQNSLYESHNTRKINIKNCCYYLIDYIKNLHYIIKLYIFVLILIFLFLMDRIYFKYLN
jgi:hypothetical protein